MLPGVEGLVDRQDIECRKFQKESLNLSKKNNKNNIIMLNLININIYNIEVNCALTDAGLCGAVHWRLKGHANFRARIFVEK